MKWNAKKITPPAILTVMLLVFLALGILCFGSVPVLAADPTDEIEHFHITVDVQEDASLRMTYQIDWKVLDDKRYGPLTWVDIGMPNRHHTGVTALGSSISRIEDKGNSLAVYLDRAYYKGEVASFGFSLIQDNMYQIDRYAEGETVYTFTPAWFDEIEVRDLTIRWNADRADAWQPDCAIDGSYLEFSDALSPGRRFTISVTYPNDAFAFSADHQAGGSHSGSSSGSDFSIAMLIGGLVVLFFFFVLPIMLLVMFIRWIAGGLGFGSSSSRSAGKKIVRTKIEYYETCPGCGAGRQEGRDDCPYCGRSMIKSKEVVEEKDLEKPAAYSKAGTYRYGNSPNTYIHVSVIPVPVSRSSGHRRSGGSGSGRSHSSCASRCACASSCACACACASSGRAGCSVKEFFVDSQIPFESASPKDEAVSITGSAACCETWQFTA